MHRLAIQKQNMKNMEQAYAVQILFSRACIDAKTVYQALFHEVPHHSPLMFTSPSSQILLGLHVYSRIAGGGVKYGRPVWIVRKEDGSLYRFFHLLAAASSLDVNRKQLIVLFVGARSAVAWYDQIGNVLRETSFWAEFVVFGSLEYNKYFFPCLWQNVFIRLHELHKWKL
jgi:hypothetical protein